jgi:hypothetical protein
VAKPTRRQLDNGDLPDLAPGVLAEWLRNNPLRWSMVVTSRAALRAVPLVLISMRGPGDVLSTFRAAAIAQFSAKHPSSAIDSAFVRRSPAAATATDVTVAAAHAATTAVHIALARAAMLRGSEDAFIACESAEAAIKAAGRAADQAQVGNEFFVAVMNDIKFLREGEVTSGKLLETPLWFGQQPARITDDWQSLVHDLRVDGDHWSVWIKWYNDALLGLRSTELEDAAFTDIPGYLPWDQGREAVNAEIGRRLGALRPDPAPIEGIISPITINRKPDGRIGVEPGPFSLPTVPAHLTPDNHRNALAACRTWAAQLKKVASSPGFQGRSEYAEFLSDYVEWLPGELGTGNILLADGGARTLNNLFSAEESILPIAFASQLRTLLEDHIGLRSYYPEIETHYEAVKTGRLVKPLSRDAVQAIQKIIRSQTPAVFDETVSPAIDEAAKPVPEIKPPLPENMPPADPNRPRPPNDPIAAADPQKSRSYIIASAYNRIWSLLQKGKDAAQAIEGWQRTYDLLKPHIGAIIDFLRHFGPGDGPGGGALPPTIGV